jgi:hypothetical protein
MGSIFKIEANWSAVGSSSPSNPGKYGLGTTVLTIKGQVECKKKVWGVQGMAERFLRQQVAIIFHPLPSSSSCSSHVLSFSAFSSFSQAVEIHTAWIKLAMIHIEKKGVGELSKLVLQPSSLFPSSSPSSASSTSGGSVPSVVVNTVLPSLLFARNRFGERVVSGTEKVVSFLAQGALSDMFPSSSSSILPNSTSLSSASSSSTASLIGGITDSNGVKPGCFSSIAITIAPDPQDEHDDSDLVRSFSTFLFFLFVLSFLSFFLFFLFFFFC